MLTIGAVALLMTVALGAALLAPAGRVRPVSRRTMAISHGCLGAFSFAVCAWALARPTTTEIGWSALVLVGLGLLLGLALVVMTRHRRSPPVLTLALHIIFAGIGAILLAGLALGLSRHRRRKLRR